MVISTGGLKRTIETGEVTVSAAIGGRTSGLGWLANAEPTATRN